MIVLKDCLRVVKKTAPWPSATSPIDPLLFVVTESESSNILRMIVLVSIYFCSFDTFSFAIEYSTSINRVSTLGGKKFVPAKVLSMNSAAQ